MNKTLIGLCFIITGTAYGMLVIDEFYAKTLGWLVKNNWIKQPQTPGKDDPMSILGRKPTILLYAGLLIIIGAFILWKQ